MPAHYEQISEGNYRIAYDDPENEDPLFGGEKGEAFPCHYDDEAAVYEAIHAAVADANSNLPPGTVFEIITKHPVPDEGLKYDFGRKLFTREQLAEEFGVAWYCLTSKASNFQEQPLRELRFDYKTAPPDAMRGCKILGRLKVG